MLYHDSHFVVPAAAFVSVSWRPACPSQPVNDFLRALRPSPISCRESRQLRSEPASFFFLTYRSLTRNFSAERSWSPPSRFRWKSRSALTAAGSARLRTERNFGFQFLRRYRDILSSSMYSIKCPPYSVKLIFLRGKYICSGISCRLRNVLLSTYFLRFVTIIFKNVHLLLHH